MAKDVLGFHIFNLLQDLGHDLNQLLSSADLIRLKFQTSKRIIPLHLTALQCLIFTLIEVPMMSHTSLRAVTFGWILNIEFFSWELTYLFVLSWGRGKRGRKSVLWHYGAYTHHFNHEVWLYANNNGFNIVEVCKVTILSSLTGYCLNYLLVPLNFNCWDRSFSVCK